MNSMYMLALMSFALVAGAAAEYYNYEDMFELCHLSKKTPEINKISEVQYLVTERLEANAGDFWFENCQAKEAIYSLDRVVAQKNVCSQEAIDAIVDFWAKYVDKKAEHRSKLPKQLKRFFIGYGLQVSKVCKTAMINELEAAAKEKGILEQDVHVVTRAIRESKRVKAIVGDRPKLEDLMIILQTDSENKDRKKISLPPKHKKYFELMQERCVNKFKPIYDTLISPAVRLASIGLNYKDDALDSKLDAFRQSQTYRDWFDAVVACEPIVHYDSVLIPARVLTEDNNVMSVLILDKEDIEELKEKTGLTLEEPAIVEPVDYKVHASVDNLVISDKQMAKQIDHYGKGLNAMTKLRFRMLKRMVPFARQMLKEKTIQFGLKPVDTGKEGKLVKFGSSEVLNHKEMAEREKSGVFRRAFALICLVGLGVTLLSVFVNPLMLIWVIGGAIIIATIIAVSHDIRQDIDIAHGIKRNKQI